MKNKFRNLTLVALLAASALISGTVLVSAGHYGAWSAPVSAESIPGSHPDVNTASGDGCPIESPDGLMLYTATNRFGLGNNDIYRFRREAIGAPWGEPERLPFPVNDNSANDFCPTPVRGRGLFFVSDRGPDSCGGNDIYFARENKDGSWEQPQNLGCGINGPAAEWSPSYYEDDQGNEILYFASTRPGGYAPGGSDADIYYSVNFGPATLAPGLNTEFHDFRPNVHRSGNEIVFDSDRPGNLGGPGTFDIWTASREEASAEWETPFHLPAPINSPFNETRASLSWDGKRLYFGSTRPNPFGDGGGNDMYFAMREKLRGNQR
jgi:hypothetical protein